MVRVTGWWVLVGLLVFSGCGTAAPAAPKAATTTAAASSLRSPTRSAPLPLVGKTIVIDPGHQLGNARFPGEINRQVPDGAGGTKACNTTGTATRDGYPEATFAWEVSLDLKRRLEAFGARVELTRSSNSADAWGPCVDVRGRAGNGTADLKISIHGDGSWTAGAHGFHVIYRDSADFARVIRTALVAGGFIPSTYVGKDGLNQRSDLGTISLATIPTVLVELGNMKDAGDAALMSSATGRQRYADALAAGVRAELAR